MHSLILVFKMPFNRLVPSNATWPFVYLQVYHARVGNFHNFSFCCIFLVWSAFYLHFCFVVLFNYFFKALFYDNSEVTLALQYRLCVMCIFHLPAIFIPDSNFHNYCYQLIYTKNLYLLHITRFNQIKYIFSQRRS